MMVKALPVRLIGTALLLVSLVGCVSQTPPATPRYYYPVPASARVNGSRSPRFLFRMGRVTCAPHLDQRMVLRVSDVEVGFDELNRWAVPPDSLTREALDQTLTKENGFLRASSPNAPTLDVHVTAFEAVASAGKALVVLEATLDDTESGAVHRRTIRAEKPTRPNDPEAVARSLGEALIDAASALGEWMALEGES